MITVEHLTKCYGDFLAVDDLSFEIDEGHVYGFLGPNGAGKSTTMNIMTGCLSATGGHVPGAHRAARRRAHGRRREGGDRMSAIFKHELHNYFHSLTAYVFGAFLLAFVGIGAMYYNIQAAISNFEYVLSFGSLVFVVIVPILTMRVIAEEKKQKTDQLL